MKLFVILNLVLIQFGTRSCSLSIEPKNGGSGLNRRQFFIDAGLGLSISSSSIVILSNPSPSHAATSPSLADEYGLPFTSKPSAGRFSFPALTPPFANRATFRYDLGRESWAFEQLLTFANVTATIRCNVIRLRETGGLWVHSPQWPTGEFCNLLNELGGAVEHVVLPCNAFEHKAPMQAFLQQYPNAQVWVSPGQFGPLGSCGRTLDDKCTLGYRVDGILGPANPLPPWSNEFDISTLYVELPKNAGPVSEVAFCHRPSKTLVATDAVVYIPSVIQSPNIFSTYFDPNEIDEPTFWPRAVLQSVFLPLRSSDDDDGGIYYPGFRAIENRLVRAPILRALVDARAPDAVREWIKEQSSQWDFDRIITSHFASPIKATPSQFRAAFDYLFTDDIDKLDPNLPPVSCKDWELLDSINKFVEESNAGAPTVFDFQRGCIGN